MTDVNAAIVDEAIRVLESFGVAYPGRGSDAEAIRARAEQYREHADAMRQSYGQVVSSLNDIDWAGSAADSHSRLAQYHLQLANDAADHLDRAADHLETHAANAGLIIRTIIGIALEILEALLATVALSWVVGWIAGLIFLNRAYWLISRAIQLCQAFRRLVASAAEVMRGVGATAGKIAGYAGEILTKWLPAYLADAATMYTGMMAPEFLSGRGLSNARDVLLYSLLPFEALDFAGYFTIHLLEQETKIGKRVKNAIDNYGTRRERASRESDSPRSPSRDGGDNASGPRSATEVAPPVPAPAEGIALMTLRDGDSVRSVAGGGERASGRDSTAKEETPEVEGSVVTPGPAAWEPDLDALVHRSTDLTLVTPEAVREGSGPVLERKTTDLDVAAGPSAERGGEAGAAPESAVKEGTEVKEGPTVDEPDLNALLRRSTDLTLVAPDAGQVARTDSGHVLEDQVALDEPAAPSVAGRGEAVAAQESAAGEGPEVDASVHRSTENVSVRVSETEEAAVGGAGYLPPTTAQVLYGAAQEFMVTATGNTILNLAHGDTDPRHMVWGLLGGGTFAAADKALRNRYALPYVMSKKPEGLPDGLWLWTVAQVMKAGVHSARFTLKAPFTDLVLGSDIDTQLGSLPSS
ncbi:WXG100 family type VII secretion target [Amycolatopsis pigmentata]|uniref:WXG100 family type VII secretion target n=1 Tax=Amycolatopsis pigmentata TaxID=450801 RepID=A0ABW5FVK3_9PSEU